MWDSEHSRYLRTIRETKPTGLFIIKSFQRAFEWVCIACIRSNKLLSLYKSPSFEKRASYKIESTYQSSIDSCGLAIKLSTHSLMACVLYSYFIFIQPVQINKVCPHTRPSAPSCHLLPNAHLFFGPQVI